MAATMRHGSLQIGVAMKKPLIATLLALAAPQAMAVSADIYAVCNLNPDGDNFLALREKPTTQSRMIMKIPPNTRLAEWGRSGDWMEVDVLIDGRPSGYVHSAYTCLVEDH